MRKQPLILVPTQSRNCRVAAVVTAVMLSIAAAAPAKSKIVKKTDLI